MQITSLVQEYGGKFQAFAKDGNVFAARSGAAAAIPVNTTLTNSPTLWNPAGSGKILIPLQISFSFATLGTQIIDGFTLSYLLNAGDNTGTAAPIVTFTNLPPVNMRVGGGRQSKAKFANGTVTFTTQPAALMDLGMGQNLNGTAANGEPYTQLRYEFNGELIMNPGTSISVGAATAATSGTYWTTIIFAELPYDDQG